MEHELEFLTKLEFIEEEKLLFKRNSTAKPIHGMLCASPSSWSSTILFISPTSRHIEHPFVTMKVDPRAATTQTHFNICQDVVVDSDL
jgi:hypothetical protein